MNLENFVKQIVTYVGGEKNVLGLSHCATRLRFTLKNNKKVEIEKIKELDEVLGVVSTTEQLQIIVGNQVDRYYDAIVSKYQFNLDNVVKEEKAEGNIFMRAISVVPKVFGPILQVLTVSGMLKVILSLLTIFKVLPSDNSTYIFLNYISDICFYFLPIFVAVSASKVFKTNTYFAVVIACILLHPTYTGIVAEGGNATIFGLPVALISYSSTMLPVLISTWILSYVEKFFKKVIPSALSFLLVPVLTIVVMAVITLVVIGPLGYYLGIYVGNFILSFYNVAGVLAVVVVSALKPLLVATGMHATLTTIFLQMFMTNGYDLFYLPASILSNLGQGGAALGVALRSKDIKTKSIGFSAAFSAIIGGITEPALYGITMKYKKAMAAAMIGSAFGGLYTGIIGVTYVAPAGMGITGALGIMPEFMIHGVISYVITLVISIVLGYLFGEEAKNKIEEKTTDLKNEVSFDPNKISNMIGSPLKGTVVSLNKVNDPSFAEEIIGKGVAIKPTEGKVVAFCDGEVTSLFPTKHAVGITTSTKEEVLIHVGIDTVKLNGKYFTEHVKQGDKVKKGDLLLTFDLDNLIKDGYNVITPIVITNKNDYMDIFAAKLDQEVDFGDAVIAIIK